jgi:hypothetical protein
LKKEQERLQRKNTKERIGKGEEKEADLGNRKELKEKEERKK